MVTDNNDNKQAEKIEPYKIMSATESMGFPNDSQKRKKRPPNAARRSKKQKELEFQGTGEERFTSRPRTSWLQERSTSLREDETNQSRTDPLRVKQPLMDHLYFVLRHLLKSDPKYISIKRKYKLIFCGFSIFQRKIWGLCPKLGESYCQK